MLDKLRSRAALSPWLFGPLLATLWLVIYVLTVSPTVNFIDSGELITALYEPGIAHPPGYPLYTLLGYVVSNVLWGEVAWRVNMLSAISGALAVGMLCVLIVHSVAYARWRDRPRQEGAATLKGSPPAIEPVDVPAAPQLDAATLLAAAAGASLLGAAATFWNRAVQAKMYTLHYFFVALILFLALQYRWAYERGDRRQATRWLVGLALASGLSMTNHLMTSLLVPGVLILVLGGANVGARLVALLRRAPLALPALLLPLLLYLYLPLRSSQQPVMNWGAPTTFPDFWRHVTGWQYRAYFRTGGDELRDSLGRVWGFITGQWGWLTIGVLVLAFFAAALVAWRVVPLFLATFTTAALTFFFTLFYGISEIEPYLGALYMMAALWIGCAPPLIDSLQRPDMERAAEVERGDVVSMGAVAAALIALIALAGAIIQYPRQNHSNNRMAELFVMNTFNNLEQNAIVLTDHWDFYAPSYYMQQVRRTRPDITVIDRSLLRYPWYLQQLEKLYPWLINRSSDLADQFREEQRKWVNGEPFDSARINDLYIQLLISFVERNFNERPAYVFFTIPCDPGLPIEACENNQITRPYEEQPAGLAWRLYKPGVEMPLPPEPKFDLRGYAYDYAPLDEFSRINGGLYALAYFNTARAYDAAKETQKASELAAKGAALQDAMAGR